MIKLIDYRNDEKGKIVFINKSCIGGMIRKEQEGLTRLWDNGVTECAGYDFKETPEEILATPKLALAASSSSSSTVFQSFSLYFFISRSLPV